MGKVLVIIAVALVVLIMMPLAAIWSVNTLFPILAIPYTVDTWMAAFLLSSIVSGQGLTASFKK